MNIQLKQKTIFIVSIATGDFFTGDENDFMVAAESFREARKIAIMAMENEGMGKRTDIRKTFISERETIYSI
jgi:hypothetical protein